MLKSLVYLLLLGGVLFAGWKDPLQYHFMSAKDVAAARLASMPEEPEVVEMRQWSPQGTSLDRAPYEVKRGTVKYSKNFDPKRAGTSTETDYRRNTTRAAGFE